MTHRDRAGDLTGHRAGRREAAGDAGHRQGFPTPSGGSPARPERRFPKAFGRRPARLAMPRIAAPCAPWPKTLGSRLYGSISRTIGIIPHTPDRAWRPDLAVTVSLVSEPIRSRRCAPEAATDRAARPRRLGTRESHRRVPRYTYSPIFTRADGE